MLLLSYDTAVPSDVYRIVGGAYVSIMEYPWTVTIVRTDTNGQAQTFGGSQIASNWVLTCAHDLIPNLPASQYKIYSGIDSFNNPDKQTHDHSQSDRDDELQPEQKRHHSQ